MDNRTLAIQYAIENNDKFLSKLNDFIRIPSISTDVEKSDDVRRCANYLAEYLSSIGIEKVQIFNTKKHPVVYGEYLRAGSSQPTLLVYGHYDVQPVDPIELWKNPPFEPTQVGDFLFGRGASDMKGQAVAVLSAIDSILQTGNFPVNLKFVFEGEEEIGSLNFHDFLVEQKELLKADVVLNPDTGMIAADIPTIVYGLRGLAYFELRITGPDRDLHSGSYGGVVHNPAQVLCDLIAGMHDENGKVTLPGFYDSVLPLSNQEREELARLKMDDAYYCQQTGVKAVWGEHDYTPVERIGGRPTLEVNGFVSGFTGQGAKTVIPSKAMAKISTRLVPNQDPEIVLKQLQKYIEENIPNTVTWELEKLSGGYPSVSDINMKETQALAQAFELVWGNKPTYKREGGSVPVTADFQQILGIDSVLTGFGLPGDNVHSPNENLNLAVWKKGIQVLIHFFFNAANMK